MNRASYPKLGNRYRALMRRLIGLLLLAGCITPVLGGQGAKVRSAFDGLPSKLQKVRALSNHQPGWGSNDFYKLSKEFLKNRTVTDFRFMLNDNNPIVRAMGLLCLAQSGADEHSFEHSFTLLAHTGDTEEVYLHDGCLISKITIAEFARRLLQNPYFLEAEGKTPAAAK